MKCPETVDHYNPTFDKTKAKHEFYIRYFDTNDKLLRGYLFFRVLQVMHRDDLLHPTFLDKSRTI